MSSAPPLFLRRLEPDFFFGSGFQNHHWLQVQVQAVRFAFFSPWFWKIGGMFCFKQEAKSPNPHILGGVDGKRTCNAIIWEDGSMNVRLG